MSAIDIEDEVEEQEIDDPYKADAASDGAPEEAPEGEELAPGKRAGLGLCLSGGGFRAALFHLGALRRLNELGILSKLDTISSVSGGSIISAHLANRIRPWPRPGTVYDAWEKDVAEPFYEFTSVNLRTMPIISRLLPRNWFKSSASVEALASAYQKTLTGMMLSDLPNRPRFIFCATDMAYGINWTMEKHRIGDFQAGYTVPPPDWSVARSVAASSCFPPIFNPLPINIRPDLLKRGRAKPGPERNERISGLRLTDGGAYDDMGLEPIWKTHSCLLVCDGGATFAHEGDKNLLWRLSRYTEIIGNQASSLRKRWLIAGFSKGGLRGAYWSIGGVSKKKIQPGYSDEMIKEVLAGIRTDMDAFSRAEIEALDNHGYWAADRTINRRLPDLIEVEHSLSNAAP